MIEAEKIGGIPKSATQTVRRGLKTFKVVSDRTTPQDLREKDRPPVQTGYSVIKVGNRDFFVPPPVRENLREIPLQEGLQGEDVNVEQPLKVKYLADDGTVVRRGWTEDEIALDDARQEADASMERVRLSRLELAKMLQDRGLLRQSRNLDNLNEKEIDNLIKVALRGGEDPTVIDRVKSKIEDKKNLLMAKLETDKQLLQYRLSRLELAKTMQEEGFIPRDHHLAMLEEQQIEDLIRDSLTRIRRKPVVLNAASTDEESVKEGRVSMKNAQAVQDYINRLEQALGTSVSARGWRERLTFLKNDPMALAVLGEIALSYGGTAAQLGGTALAILSKRFGPWGLVAGEAGELLIGKLHREHTDMNENEIMAYNIAVRDTLAVFLGRDINDPALDGILMKVLNPRNLAQTSHNVTPVTRSAAKLASKRHGQR